MNPEKRKSFLSVLFVILMDNFGFGLVFVMFAPLVFSPQYSLVAPDTSIAMRNFYLALLFAGYPLTQLFGAPLLGDIADQIGRKKALYLSIAGVVIGFLFSGFALLVSSMAFLVFSRLVSGFFAGNLSICLSAIADLSPTEKNRSRNFGIVTVVWAISWNIAMLVGGYLSDPTKSRFFSPSLPFWVTAVLTMLSFVAIAKWYTETHPPGKRSRLDIVKGIHNIHAALKIKSVRPYFLVLIIWTVGWGLSVQWFGAYTLLEYNSSQEAISWGLFTQGLTWSLGGSIINPLLLKKLKSLPIAMIGYLGCTFFLILTALANNFILFSVFYCTAAMFSSFAFSNTMNLASIHAPEEIQGKIMGLSQSMMSFGWVLVPILGAITNTRAIGLFYPISALVVGLALIFLFIELKRKKA